MTTVLTARIAAEIAHHEGLVREAYRDSVGVLTWSVGLTDATGHKVGRYVGKPATLERCLEVYAWALDAYADKVRGVFAGHELTEAQFGGALDFHWNTGRIHTATWPRLWKAGDVAGARRSYLSWRKPPEIIPRREKGAALFFDGAWSGDGTAPEFPVSRPGGTPVWGKGRPVDVLTPLRAIFEA